MNNYELTIEEQEAKALLSGAKLPAPDRRVLNSILAAYQPTVTHSQPDRIPNQDEATKGRPQFLQAFFENILMPWKKIIPVGALAVLLVVAVAHDKKPTTPNENTNQPKQAFETKIAASGNLTNTDIDIAIDELAADITAEEVLLDEAELTSFDEIFNLEPIYQTYEL